MRTGSSPRGHLCHHLYFTFEGGETQSQDGSIFRSLPIAPEEWTPEPGFLTSELFPCPVLLLGDSVISFSQVSCGQGSCLTW